MATIHAPELEPYVTWLNTARPLRMKDLRGQLVILDFWTYCCINCMHVIPLLQKIEHKYADQPIVVIGVHSAKFEAESEPKRIADAIGRYGIEHPVVVDRDMEIWQRFAVRSWPTLVFVRPDGTIAAVAPGEPDADMLDQFVHEQLEEARAKGTLASAPVQIERVAPDASGPLFFPGKIAIEASGRLAISDSGHHRVLITTRDGLVEDTIGSGLRGWADGAFENAAFDDPQGLAWDGNALWICDARNHTVHRADLTTRTVTTIAGNGTMGATVLTGRAPARERPLRSPWDIVVRNETLFIAMAGTHQIWTVDKLTGDAGPYAGSGREALVDGALATAAFAQPSGLALHKSTLFVADSETSSVRAIELQKQNVTTLVGIGLFDFGQQDGAPEQARLQHALGVAVAPDGSVIVADTYNDRLRRIDASTGRVSTIYVGSENQTLREPSAIAADPAGGFVVTDTNNHRLVRFTNDGQWLDVVRIEGALKPKVGDLPRAQTKNPSDAKSASGWYTSSLEPTVGRSLAPGNDRISLSLTAPNNWKFAVGSTCRVLLEVSRRSDLVSLEDDRHQLVVTDQPIEIPLAVRIEKLPSDEVASEILVIVDVVLCSDSDNARCVPTRAWFRLPIMLTRDGDHTLRYSLPIAEPTE